MHALARAWCETAGGPVVRKWLEDMGVLVIEDPRLHDDATYIEDIGVLLIRPEIAPCDLAAAVDSILLDSVPQPHREPGT